MSIYLSAYPSICGFENIFCSNHSLLHSFSNTKPSMHLMKIICLTLIFTSHLGQLNCDLKKVTVIFWSINIQLTFTHFTNLGCDSSPRVIDIVLRTSFMFVISASMYL